ncbi:MAG TPA: hypothetical protein VF112_06430, partial [Candidatus Dormibacteraeota bacterium]
APVDVTALDPGHHDAIVFPLGAGSGGVEGLAVFLRACGDEAYFSTVADLAAAPPPNFPTLSRDRAARMLGTATPALVYDEDPLRPRWLDSRTGASVPAT